MAKTERTDNMVPNLVVKSNAGNSADVLLWADPSTHRLLIDGSFSGSLTNNNAAPSSANIGVLPAVANAAAPSWTEGNQVLLSTDLAGALRVTGTLSVGGTTDNSAFTAGTSTGTPILGFYHASVDTVTDGRSAAIAITSKRGMHAVLHAADGTALLGQKAMTASIPVVLASDQASIPVAATLAAETTKVIGTVRNLGNIGAIFDGVVTAATSPANGIMGLGIYNSTEPSPTTGQSVGIQLDAKGRQRQVIMDAAGNTRGVNVTAGNALTVDGSATTQPVSIATNTPVGAVAHDAVATAVNPLLVGAYASAAVPSDVSADGDSVRLWALRSGALGTQPTFGGVLAVAGNGASGTGVQRVTIANDSTGILAGVTTVTTVTTVSTVTAVTSVNAVIPGTGATNLGKARDSAIGATDTGVAMLGVRRDTPTAETPAAGDYVVPQISANGEQWVRSAVELADDAAFTPATSRVVPIGFLVDDTATDSVDEGDIGAARMSADRIQYVQGALASDAVDAGNPLKIGGQARTTNPTAVADADRVNFISDKLGKQVVVGSIRDLKVNQITTITSSTSETTVITAVASTFLDVYGCIVVNSSATAANVSFKDSTAGTTRFNIYVPAGETRGFTLTESAAFAQTTVNNNWTATSSASVASLIITMLAVKNT